MPEQSPPELGLIWGASAIAAALGTTRRRAFHLLESGALPAKKLGGRWVVSRDALRRLFGSEAA
jgi:hypothetical protein